MPRSGATLTEVLIALAVMSIGLVSVATMFPISVVRSLMASQLTKGTDLRFNAESLIDVYPRMIDDPDMTHAAHLATEFFVVDPLGSAAMTASYPALAGTFGNLNNGSGPTVLTQNFTGTLNTTGGINRYSFVPKNMTAADYLVTFPDTWVTVHEGTASNCLPLPSAATSNGYTNLVVSGLGGGGFTPPTFTITTGNFRAVITSDDGTKTHVRRLTNYVSTSGTIYWTEDLDGDGTINGSEVDSNGNGVPDAYPLPGTVNTPTGGAPTFRPYKVRIESQERRYTWLLTGRRLPPSNQSSVDVVIFFGRSFENPTDDEALYPSYQLVAGTKVFTIDYSKYATRPEAKRGGYTFDVNNARWYRITSTLDDPSNKRMTIGIEVQAFASQPTTGPGYVMFPKGVVDVYPLVPKGTP